MQSPSFENRVCTMFDSFCKKVSRNFARNYDRAERNRTKHYGNEPIELLLELLGNVDVYPSELLTLHMDGLSCIVRDETLYGAMLTLTEDQRTVLVMHYWFNCQFGFIAERLGVSTRSVYNLRMRAFGRIYDYYERRGYSPRIKPGPDS